eukprot:TRINITY_DN10830_c0_g1_i1.p1 TRINITY_DN10830_c0_g1~~TRINITY_DN10830_c0_g1_i1.p1  ORF type:complete len:443 (+),score=87.97 TRINITY_DN10830_c0_g1_i1:38-1330(+)
MSAKSARMGRPPERPYEQQAQDVLPRPVDGLAAPEGLVELDSMAEQRWWAQMQEQRASVTEEKTYTQQPDRLVMESFRRDKQTILQAWLGIKNDAFNHVKEVTVIENAKQHASPPRIRAFRFGSSDNFRASSGANLDNLATALSHLWMYRWLCGAYPYDIRLDTQKMSLAHYAAVLMEETGFSSIDKVTGYTEHPAQPVVSCISGRLQATMADEEYAFGREGTGCGMGFISTPPRPLVEMLHSFVHDSDEIDVGSLPHRRWVLAPGMMSTGFGAYYSSSVMHVADHMVGPAQMGDFIAYPPPGWFPSKWMQPNAAWSCSINPRKYWIAPNASVTVYKTLISMAPCGCRVPPGTACPLHRRGEALPPPYEEDFTRISNSGFGGSPCLIFRPQGVSLADGEAYEVLIQGIWAAGERITLRYITRFFDFPEDL